ncbi:MAG: OmpA family protein [Gemmatimonadota bacterium]
MPEDFFAVAPTDDSVPSEHNQIGVPLRPIADWQLDDSHFAFDSSILLPSMTADLADLIALIRANPRAPLSVFGHADPVGNDDYNKQLSGRRAMALYALLTRRVDLWEKLFQTALGGDDWRKGDQATAIMQRHLGMPVIAKPPGRAQLFEQYMTAISRDPDDKPFGLPKTAFLGAGADPNGKADFQGCGEFNPLIMFSAAEAAALEADHDKRNEENAPNRRVTVFLFSPGSKVVASKWPCPRALEGPAGCRLRFWSDAEKRRTFQAARRERTRDGDTFACRFYDRLTELNTGLGDGRLVHISLLIHDAATQKPVANTPYRLTRDGLIVDESKTGADGLVFKPHLAPGDFQLELDGKKPVFVPAVPVRFSRLVWVVGFEEIESQR